MRLSPPSEDTHLARGAASRAALRLQRPPGLAVRFAERASDVSHILTRADIFDASSEDGDPELSNEAIEAALQKPSCRFVVAAPGCGRPIGMFMFLDRGDGQWELHTAFLPDHRGAVVLAAFREAARLMRSAHRVGSIVTHVPATNSPAGRIAVAAGFSRKSVLHRAFRKGRALHDVIVYEISGDRACL